MTASRRRLDPLGILACGQLADTTGSDLISVCCAARCVGRVAAPWNVADRPSDPAPDKISRGPPRDVAEREVTAPALAESERRAEESLSAVKELRNEMKQLKNKVKKSTGEDDDAPSGKHKSKGKGPKCYNCGEFGHLAKDCPNGKDSEEE